LVLVGFSGSDFALLRLTGDGAQDASFGSKGKVKTDFGGGHAEAHAVAIQPDGKLMLLGYHEECTRRYGVFPVLSVWVAWRGMPVSAPRAAVLNLRQALPWARGVSEHWEHPEGIWMTCRSRRPRRVRC
jgi:hypothetical protein